MATSAVSAIVTTRNEVAHIARCLRSIREQTVPVELIVVDNHSTDGTLALASSMADLVLRKGPERSSQRNAGAAAASGDYLLFLDADMELERTVIADCLEASQAGANLVTIPERSVGQGLWAAAKALERACYAGDETIEAPRFFSRAVFERYGGYAEELTGPEDWDLPARMRATESVARIPSEIVHHEGTLRLSNLARKKFYYGKSFGRYMRRHPALATKQIVRPAFVREWRRLVARPGLTTAMLLMKAVEYASGAAGAVSSILPTRRNAPQPRR